MKLDFSQFHPLDHWPWEHRCWSRQIQPGHELSFKGGPWHHMKLAWTYHWRDVVLGPWFKITRCRRGQHNFMYEVRDRPRRMAFCIYCSHIRAMTPEECAKHPSVKFGSPDS